MELRIGLSYSSTRKHRLSYLGSLKPPADSNRWLGILSKAVSIPTPPLSYQIQTGISLLEESCYKTGKVSAPDRIVKLSPSPPKKLPVMPIDPPSKCIKQRLVHCIYLGGNFVPVGMV